MKYDVIWTWTAKRQLADLWVKAIDRGEITAAADALDDVVRHDAHRQGEARHSTMRIVFVPPLASYIDVRQDDARVYVLAIWRR
jgi:hypothetical protein